jgi:polyisoprenoid-binding protein YceI
MSIRPLLGAALLLLALGAPTPVGAAKAPKAPKTPPAKSLLEGVQLFSVGAAHSSVEFSVAWMGISRVRGAFSDFSGALALDRNDLTRSSATIIIRTKSLTTFNERRDRDLKGPDWFDVEKFPTATFTSREVVKQGDEYLLRGPLSLHGVTKDIEIPFTLNGFVRDAGGDERVGFEGRLALNRKDYSIVGQARFNAIMELGKAMVGDQVELPLAVEAIRTTPKDTLQDRAADSLWRAITTRGVAAIAKDYRALRATTPDSLMTVNEFRLNAVGLQLVESGKPADGLEVFKLQAEAFPLQASGLVGVAYAAATLGDRETAVVHAEKAVAINPGAARALEILRRVKPAGAN